MTAVQSGVLVGRHRGLSGMAGLWFSSPLWMRVLPALVLGALLGLISPAAALDVRWMGEVFTRLTRMLVAPLVFVSISSGVVALGDVARLGSLGARSVGLFLLTAFVATSLGLVIGTFVRPGAGVSVLNAVPERISAGRSIHDQLLGVIPLNPVQALAQGDMLAIIFFAVLVGAGVLAVGARGAPLAALLSSGSDVMTALVKFVMETAPFGVFGLVAGAVAANGLGLFASISKLALCVLLGCGIQALLVQPGLVRLFTGLSGLRFLRRVIDAAVVAFSTSSSSASLPAELSVAERNLGIGAPVASTVLPLGVSIGRDGTAFYVGLLSVFAAQALGAPLALRDLAVVACAATLMAVGTPPVPSSSLFMMAAVLSVIRVPDSQSAVIVGFILPFDRVLDMIRTVPNVLGNLANATVVAHWTGELDRDVFNTRPTA